MTTTKKPDEIVLVYNADSGLAAMLADAVKKAIGVEDCALCEITHSAFGQRREWTRCAAQLGVSVTTMHRDELPAEWAIGSEALPCVLARHGGARPEILLGKAEIAALSGDVGAFGSALRRKLE